MTSELPEKKNSGIVVYCKAGVRSQKAALALKRAGFTNVSNLTGGILAGRNRSIGRCQSIDYNLLCPDFVVTIGPNAR
jgi:predicted sulfurtransferase